MTLKNGKARWSLHVYFLDSCNCDWGCPCQFNAKPTHGNCEGVGGYHIINGKYNDIQLDGLNMALIISFPGPIHEGRGNSTYYIDNRATDDQFHALSEIITGKAGGAPFEVYASVIEKSQPPKRAEISFDVKGIDSHLKVGEYAEAWLEPIRNPVTGQIHRVMIEIPEGFESNRMDQASVKNMFVKDDTLNFRYAGTYGSFSECKWKSH